MLAFNVVSIFLTTHFRYPLANLSLLSAYKEMTDPEYGHGDDSQVAERAIRRLPCLHRRMGRWLAQSQKDEALARSQSSCARRKGATLNHLVHVIGNTQHRRNIYI